MYRKRAQAAMEFLMTYGWAILAAVIVVGVLWYMIGDPGNLAGNRAQLSPPFSYQGVGINGTAGTVQIEFINGKGMPITVTSVAVNGCTTNTTRFEVAQGGTGIAQVGGCSTTAGAKISGAVAIAYNTSTGGIAQSGSGSINVVVP